MYILNNRLYARTYINGANYIGLVDTGAPKDCIELTKRYYTINKANLLVNGILKEKSKDIKGMAQTISSLKYKPILNPEVTFNSKTAKLTTDNVIAWQEEVSLLGMKDGLIGCKFLKRLGSKVNFDFANMRLTEK